ncbi:MAG: hypothetical protein LBB61_08940, partial [Treponema sp.]|nr:hypothetical protein [Treponema sp.]
MTNKSNNRTNAPVTEQEIIDGYRFILNRLPESEEVIKGRLRSKITFKQFHDELWNSAEFKTICSTIGSSYNYYSGYKLEDIPLLEKYANKNSVQGENGFITDFLGIRHSLGNWGENY